METKNIQTELARLTQEQAYDRAALDELHAQLAEQTAEVAGVSQRLSELVGERFRLFHFEDFHRLERKLSCAQICLRSARSQG